MTLSGSHGNSPESRPMNDVIPSFSIAWTDSSSAALSVANDFVQPVI